MDANDARMPGCVPGRPTSLHKRAPFAGAALVALVSLAVPAVAGASPVQLSTGAATPATTTPATTLAPRQGRAAAGGGLGNATTSKGEPGKAIGKGKAAKAKTARPVKPFIEPRPVVVALLGALGSEERQVLALRTYSEAQRYAAVAERRSQAASLVLTRARAVLAAAKAAERQALLTQGAARSQVHLYQGALYELGMAEYTGRAATAGTDLASEERQIQFSELADVTAVAGGSGLGSSQRWLAAATRHVRAEKKAVARAVLATERALAALRLASAQLARSRHALLVAKTWAVVPGAAPAQPVRALLVLETAPATGASRRANQGRGPDRARGVLVAGPLRASGPLLGASPSTTLAGRSAAGAARGSRPSSQPGAQPWVPANAGGPSILGPSILSAGDIVGWFESTGEQANTTVPLKELALYYLEAARLTGVRGDIAFAQSIVETGYFSFPADGQDAPSYNNFAGIGACGSCKHGWKFSSALSGVMTQESLLSEYAEPPPLYGPPGGLVAGLGIAGCCRTWMALSGVWASNPNYGYDILSVYKEMLDWAIGSELKRTGLLPTWASSPRLLRD